MAVSALDGERQGEKGNGMKAKSWRIYAFAAVLVLAALAQIIMVRASELRMGPPMAMRGSGEYVVVVEHGANYFAAIFDSPAQVQAFARLGAVKVR